MSTRDPSQLSVGIVGAGPAGLTFAYHLSQLGVRDITVFDRDDAVGGQSVTRELDGVPVELGTCYLSAGYIMPASIIRETGCSVERMPPATVLDERGHERERDDPPLWLVARYVGEWLRWYARGQLQRPSEADNALRLDRWLHARGLRELSTDFTFSAGLTAQLYGPLDAVSAHSGMTWLRPSLFVTGRLSATYVIPEGFGTFWRRLAQQLGVRLELGVEVEAVVASADGPSVELAAPRSERRHFDLIYIGCPLDGLEHPLRPALDRHEGFEDSAVYSAIWRARGWPSFAPSRCYLPACVTGEPGRVLTVRRVGGRDGLGVGQLAAYAVRGRTAAEHREQVLADLREIVGLRDIELVEDRTWRYNIRYAPAQLRAGVPVLIDANQGRGGVWYGGGALAHWNVDSITDQNHTLARRVARALELDWRARLRLVRIDELVRDL